MRPHSGDRLSALVDGQLDPAEAAATREHVAGCPACAGELHAVRAVRRLLRNLPAVEPPATFGTGAGPAAALPARARLGPGRRRALASVAASAAAGIGLLLAGSGDIGRSSFAPQVSGAVSTHSATMLAVAGGDDRRSSIAPPGPHPPRDPSRLPAPYRAPDVLEGGYRLTRAFATPYGLHLLYRHDRYGLSVFEARGTVDVGSLPPGTVAVEVPGARGWRWEAPGVAGRVVVLERDGLVVTLVGDEQGDAVLVAARSLPAPRPLSLAQRLRRASEAALDALAPIG